MTILEAAVWCFGILIAGITASSVANSFAKAVQTVKITKAESKEGSNETPNAPEGR